MTPLIVWMTRPDAFEVYMGGDRKVDLWITKPSYSHIDVADDFNQQSRYVDTGWIAAHSRPQLARYILEQDKTLHYNVMDEIIASLVPKGVPDTDVYQWAAAQHQDGDVNWRQLYSDRDWELKCRVNRKRFLLEVDLRSNSVKRIDPAVFLRSEDRSPGPQGYIITSEIPDHLAGNERRQEHGVDFIPF